MNRQQQAVKTIMQEIMESQYPFKGVFVETIYDKGTDKEQRFLSVFPAYQLEAIEKLLYDLLYVQDGQIIYHAVEKRIWDDIEQQYYSFNDIKDTCLLADWEECKKKHSASYCKKHLGLEEVYILHLTIVVNNSDDKE